MTRLILLLLLTACAPQPNEHAVFLKDLCLVSGGKWIKTPSTGEHECVELHE